MKNLVSGFLFGLIVMNPLLSMDSDFGIGNLKISSSLGDLAGKENSEVVVRERSGSNDSGRYPGCVSEYRLLEESPLALKVLTGGDSDSTEGFYLDGEDSDSLLEKDSFKISSLPRNLTSIKSFEDVVRRRSGSNDSGQGMSSPGKTIRQISVHGIPRVSSGMLPGDGASSPTFRQPSPMGFGRLDLESLIYERATEEDADALMSIYDNFNADDYNRLLVFPGVDSDGVAYQRKFLLASLAKGRVFVARLPGSGKIIAFLKLFVIDNKYELRDILKNELRALRPATSEDASSITIGDEVLTECDPCDAASCDLDPSFVFDFSRKPDYINDIPAPVFKHKRENTYVYYGSAYTLLEKGAKGKDYRGLGINFKLEQKALEIISLDIQRQCFSFGSKEIFYVYGVVEANSSTTARLRAASIMIRVLLTNLKIKIIEPIRLSSFAFRTFKPSFYQDDLGEPLKLLADDPLNAGFGTLIGYRISE